MLVLLDEADCPVARPVRPWDRLMARMRASRLDSDLADGASPDATVTLALRAQLLVGARTRRDVAEGARRVLATAIQAPGTQALAADPSLAPAARGPHVPAVRGLQMPAARDPHMPAVRGLQMPAVRGLRIPICRDRVRESAEEFGDLIQRLLADGPVAARGVALASALLSDASGPLYHRGNADDVRARVREAVNALDPLTA